MDGCPRPPRQHQIGLHIGRLPQLTEQLHAKNRAARSGHTYDDPSHRRGTSTARCVVTVAWGMTMTFSSGVGASPCNHQRSITVRPGTGCLCAPKEGYALERLEGRGELSEPGGQP